MAPPLSTERSWSETALPLQLKWASMSLLLIGLKGQVWSQAGLWEDECWGQREAWHTAHGPGTVSLGRLYWVVVGGPLRSLCNMLACCGNPGESRSMLWLAPKSMTASWGKLVSQAQHYTPVRKHKEFPVWNFPTAHFSGFGGHFLEAPGPKTPFSPLLHDFPFKNDGHCKYIT